MKFDAVHHIAIIGSDYDKTREFYVEKLGFEQVDEHIRPEKMIFSSMSKRQSDLGNFHQTRCTNASGHAQS